MKNLFYGLTFLLFVGCNETAQKKPVVDVVFMNASKHDLNWVGLKLGERELSAGVLPPGIDKTYSDVSWSAIPDQAKITFIDDKSREAYSIDVSLTALNAQIQAGNCHTVTIRILDYTKGEVICK